MSGFFLPQTKRKPSVLGGLHSGSQSIFCAHSIIVVRWAVNWPEDDLLEDQDEQKHGCPGEDVSK